MRVVRLCAEYLPVVRPFGSGWGLFRGRTLVEGGFSSRAAAEAYRDKEYNTDGSPK